MGTHMNSDLVHSSIYEALTRAGNPETVVCALRASGGVGEIEVHFAQVDIPLLILIHRPQEEHKV